MKNRIKVNIDFSAIEQSLSNGESCHRETTCGEVRGFFSHHARNCKRSIPLRLLSTVVARKKYLSPPLVERINSTPY